MWGDRVIVERKEYLEKLIAWKDKKLIKIVTGVRRCGNNVKLRIM
jgi:predicted AAA+ superfamily ATPase